MSFELEDSITIRDRRIVAIGARPSLEVQATSAQALRTMRAFDPAVFDPSVTSSFLRYATMKAAEAGRTGLRALFADPGEVKIRWPEWERLAVADRRRLFEQFRTWPVTINGRRIVRRRVDRPVLRWFNQPRVASDLDS